MVWRRRWTVVGFVDFVLNRHICVYSSGVLMMIRCAHKRVEHALFGGCKTSFVRVPILFCFEIKIRLRVLHSSSRCGQRRRRGTRMHIRVTHLLPSGCRSTVAHLCSLAGLSSSFGSYSSCFDLHSLSSTPTSTWSATLRLSCSKSSSCWHYRVKSTTSCLYGITKSIPSPNGHRTRPKMIWYAWRMAQ